MSVISDIKIVLKNRIAALSGVGIVYGYEHPNPAKFPAVFVVPNTLEGEFVTTAENRRTFNFTVSVVMPTGQNIPKDGSEDILDKVESMLYNVFDNIVNDLDSNSYDADFADLSASTSQFLYINASDAEWGYFSYDGGVARALQINLAVQVDFTARTS